MNKWNTLLMNGLKSLVMIFSCCYLTSLMAYPDFSSSLQGNNSNNPVFSQPTEGSSIPSSGPMKQSAFQNLLQNYFPLTPDEIHEFKDAVAQQQQANATPPGKAPPKGTSSIIPVTLKPGGIMPVIRVGQGMITSLVFTDASGEVWPIHAFSIGDPSAFNVQWDKKSGVLMIQGQKLYAETNIGVMLNGLSVPVMLTLLIGQKDWDYLDYVQLDQNQVGDSTPGNTTSQAPSYLTDLLNGIPPDGAISLNVSNPNTAQIWSYQGQYIMTTRATLLSPAWTSRANGPGPTPIHAYAFPPAPEVLISDMGSLEKILVNPGTQNVSNH